MLYERMLAESKRLAAEIQSLQSQLKGYPPGKLICTQNGKYHKWYSSDGKTQTYIPKENVHLAEQLAAKKYLSCLLKDLTQEKIAIDMYLRHHTSYCGKSEQLLSSSSTYSSLLSPYFTCPSEELQEWQNTPYPQNTSHPEQLIHKSLSGHIVRSKSEAMIDSLLHLNKIPFRYEAPLTLSGITLYPDFTILHPRTKKIIYWEHFGLMDDPVYRKNALSKLDLFISHNLIPSIHFIMTFEGKNHPLTSDTIENIITHHFL